MIKIIIEVAENSHRHHALMKLLRTDNYIFSIENENQSLRQLPVIGRSELLLDFIQWYNDHHPENYIPNSRLGNYLQEKSSNSL